jgi:stage IV sporulation protein FB
VISKSVVGGWLLALLASMLLILPVQWVIAAVLAAVFHELCHYLAIRLCGGRVQKLQAGTVGAKMEAAGLNTFQELLCSMAGPLGSLLLLFLARWLPRTALCAGFQGIYNLLPVYPLDGGRVLRCGAALLLPVHVGEAVCKVIERLCLCMILFLGIYGTFFKGFGMLPLAVAVFIVWRTIENKNPLQTGRVFGTIE